MINGASPLFVHNHDDDVMFRFQPDMINILYTQEPGGEVLVYQSYDNRHDRQRAYDYLLDKGYEIVGEE